MAIGRHLVSGVDIWLNTPTRPMEASGTSGEKAVMNGVLNLSVLDGWWAEGYQENAGWAIPEAKTYANQAFQDELDAEIIYRQLEEEVVPVYFDRDDKGISKKWVGYIKNNIAEIAPKFTMKRMVDDYYEYFYSKLFGRVDKIRENNYQLAHTIEEWKSHIRNNWHNMEIKSLRLPNSTIKPLDYGEQFEVEIVLDTNGINPNDIGVDIVMGQKEFDKVERIYLQKDLEMTQSEGSEATFKGSLNLTDPGVFDFAFRIFPKSDLLPHKQDFCLVKWI
jgi:glucan phosphorylase